MAPAAAYPFTQKKTHSHRIALPTVKFQPSLYQGDRIIAKILFSFRINVTIVIHMMELVDVVILNKIVE